MEMKEGTSMEEHIKRMKELTDRLATLNAPVSEEDQVVTLLGSLPPSYSNLYSNSFRGSRCCHSELCSTVADKRGAEAERE